MQKVNTFIDQEYSNYYVFGGKVGFPQGGGEKSIEPLLARVEFAC